MRRRMRARSIRTMVAVLALSLSLSACDPQSLMTTVLDFLSGTGAEAPAAGAVPEADEAADDAAADEAAGEDEAAGDEAAEDAGAKRNHHRKDDGAADEAADEDAADDDAAGDDDAADDGAAGDDDAADDGAADTGLSAVEQEIFETLNATRAEAGLDELALVADIAAGSRDYACTMAETGVFEHADIAAAGVNGENIAAGQRSAAEVHQAWMDSPGHRDNRMNAAWTEYGIGVCEDADGRPYYVERFR